MTSDMQLRHALQDALAVLQRLEWRWDKFDEQDAPELGEEMRDAIKNAHEALIQD